MRRAFGIALVAACLSSPILAQSQITAGSPSDPTTKNRKESSPVSSDDKAPLDTRIANGRVAGFDIAGVRLGMTPQEAIDRAAKAGFKISSSSTGPSFADNRLEALRKRQPDFAGSKSAKVVREQFFKGPQGDYLSVEFASMPEGSRVEKIRYTFKPSRTDAKDVERTIFKKFGSPNGRAIVVGNFKWCDNQCQNGDASAKLALPVFNSVQIDGRDPAQSYIQKLIDADVDRLAPKAKAGI